MGQQPFGDIPLFRELQRLLAASGDSPVNLEVAGQVATSIALEGNPEGLVPEEERRLVLDTVRLTEASLAGYTRISLTEPISSAALTRREWIDRTLVSWRWLFERLAARFIDDFGGRVGTGEAVDQMQLVMKQIGPLLMGLQAGALVGHLAREVLSGYDPSIPRDGDHGISIVLPNVHTVGDDYGLDRSASTRWLVLQDVARHLIVQGVPWVPSYRKSLMTDLIDAIEIDAEGLEKRLMDLQGGGLEALQEGVTVDTSIPLVPTERHTAALNRVKAFVGLHEGYAARAAAIVGPQTIGDVGKVEEAISRYRAGHSAAKALLANVLGFSLDRDLVTTGMTFCAAIAKLEGLPLLNRVWDAPDNLPTYAELQDPFLWIDRVKDPQSLT